MSGRRARHPLVRADVLARIEGGTLKPGMVASIAEMRRRLGVGRTAAAKAMAALAAEGVLERRPGIGYVVCARAGTVPALGLPRGPCPPSGRAGHLRVRRTSGAEVSRAPRPWECTARVGVPRNCVHSALYQRKLATGGAAMTLMVPSRPDGFRHVARVLCALAGGTVKTAADEGTAGAIEARWPGTAAQVRAARGFHARVAAWAVREEGARGLIVAPAGYPCDPDPHAAALAAAPGARVLLADIDDEVTWVNREFLGADPRVTVAMAPASSPAALMSSPQAQTLPRPLCVLIPFAAMMLPAQTCAAALAVYGRLLPAGSLVAVSLWTPDGGPGGERFLRDWGDRVAPAYGHSAEDVAKWLKGAGMEAVREPRDVRARTGREWAEEGLSRCSPGRMTGAVARVL